jgi:HEAT repeat protein
MPTVFISYVRNDYREVHRLVDALRVYGVTVWLDQDQLQPGQRWRDEIRKGIEQGDFFLACFSHAYHERWKTYMNEEITLAIEELRQRPVDRSWFIPVLLSDCQVPDRSIGGGETLRSLQWVSLYSDWTDGVRRILSLVVPKSGKIFELVASLSDSSARARIKAADELGKLSGLAIAAVPALIDLVADKNETVRAAAADALGKIGDPSAIPALLSSLDRDDYAKEHASRSLVKFSEAAVPGLIVKLKNLEQMRDSQKRYWLPIAIAQTLQGIGRGGVAAVPALLEAIEENRCDLRSAFSALGSIGDLSALPALIDAANHGSEAAVEALGDLGSKEAVPVLIDALDKNEYHSEAAATALGKIGDPRAVPALIRNILLEKEERYKDWPYAAIYALGRIGDPSALPVLIQTLKHENSWSRSAAAHVLGEMHEPSAVQSLIEQVIAGRDQDSSCAAAEALGKIGDESAIPVLRETLSDESQWRRLSAATALVDFGDNAAIPALVRLIKEGDKIVVGSTAAELLLKLGTPEAIAALARRP